MALQRVSGGVASEHTSPVKKRPGCESQLLAFYSVVEFVSYDPYN